MTGEDRLFIGCFATGIAYADRHHELGGDYKRLGFLRFSDLELTVEADCPADLARRIELHAAELQARRGQTYRITTSGQTITLGYAASYINHQELEGLKCLT